MLRAWWWNEKEAAPLSHSLFSRLQRFAHDVDSDESIANFTLSSLLRLNAARLAASTPHREDSARRAELNFASTKRATP